MTTTYNTSPSVTVANSRVVKPMRSVHHVKPGETKESIASAYGMTTADLVRNNSHVLGGSSEVHPGMRLEVA